jgi:hypothetical protein
LLNGEARQYGIVGRTAVARIHITPIENIHETAAVSGIRRTGGPIRTIDPGTIYLVRLRILSYIHRKTAIIPVFLCNIFI